MRRRRRNAAFAGSADHEKVDLDMEAVLLGVACHFAHSPERFKLLITALKSARFCDDKPSGYQKLCTWFAVVREHVVPFFLLDSAFAS